MEDTLTLSDLQTIIAKMADDNAKLCAFCTIVNCSMTKWSLNSVVGRFVWPDLGIDGQLKQWVFIRLLFG